MTSIACLEEVQSFTFHAPKLFRAAARPGVGFVTVQLEGMTRLWSPRWEVVDRLKASRAFCIATSQSEDIVVGLDTRVEVWRDNTRVLTLTGHTDIVWAVAVSPLDGTIVSGCSDLTAKVWNGSTGECVATLPDHYSVVQAVCVLDNGDVLTGSWDKRVRVWAHGSWTCTAVHNCPSTVTSLVAMPLGGFAVGGGSFSNGGGFVGAWRGGVRQWEVETERKVQCLAAVRGAIIACTQQEYMAIWEGTILGQCGLAKVQPVALGGGKVALVTDSKCSVYRVVRPSRIVAIHTLVAAWGAHGGAPPPSTDAKDPAAVLARTLSLRRFCRPRGETEVGRALEVVEPFGQAVVAYL